MPTSAPQNGRFCFTLLLFSVRRNAESDSPDAVLFCSPSAPTMCFTGRKSSTDVRSFVPNPQHLRPLLPFVSRVVGRFNPLRQIAENSHPKSASAEHKKFSSMLQGMMLPLKETLIAASIRGRGSMPCLRPTNNNSVHALIFMGAFRGGLQEDALERTKTFMPFIRVTTPVNAFTAEQKAKLAPLLVEAVMGQEIDPMTDIGRAATGFFFDEIEGHNCFPGGVPLIQHPEKTFWIVEAVVAASFFSQPRRDALQMLVAKAFVDVLGDDGSVLDREGVRISPAYLMRLHCVVVEIPEGSWGAGGQTVDTNKISKLIGATQGPERLAEATEIGAKMKAARIS